MHGTVNALQLFRVIDAAVSLVSAHVYLRRGGHMVNACDIGTCGLGPPELRCMTPNQTMYQRFDSFLISQRHTHGHARLNETLFKVWLLYILSEKLRLYGY